MESRCRCEIIDLHKFLQNWFNGEVERSEAGFARFAEVLAEEFVLISPDGQVTRRSPLATRLHEGHGSWTSDGDERGWIRIDDVRMRHFFGDMAVLTYEEWQEARGERRGRLSTVVFRSRADTPQGVEWLHLHEVWLPGKSS